MNGGGEAEHDLRSELIDLRGLSPDALDALAVSPESPLALALRRVCRDAEEPPELFCSGFDSAMSPPEETYG
ncbi:FxSxx-COOH cyclophane-containing RiPP peptide [Spongiactinospora sp. TRM90649]|uniref:FxSxx-COOH cyclophane-containing RiPP peptide n=1 Tax=Spongiactinospora sp. TRM90649 TaxID=3031114 RepID=UPI0023F858C9|nr:FxSxx-COOH cyclophane-containing RiPP peptide [Spongiactinospora sp. TRM90649]MDF5755842.1 FxSxx-COOH protein [Spongiactinospora sp. TRM90649]